MTDATYYRSLLAPIFAGQKWIIAVGVLAATTPLVRTLRDFGSEPVFIVSASQGTGELPTKDDADWITLDVRAQSMMAEIRATESAYNGVEGSAREAIDRYDPQRIAQVIGTPFATQAQLAGRPRYSWRRPEWAALEDKIVVDELWDEAGVPRERVEVVPAQANAMLEAARSTDRGAGTVWAGDAFEGHNGGGEYVRLVLSDEDRAEAIAFFGTHCKQVRVMPFLEGIPCSIHGMVFDDAEIVFRPVELVTLRRPTPPRFRYAGISTFWDPSVGDREDMRAVAKRVATALRQRVDYRGGFSVDGVMTSEGFRPTELNPRFSGGLNVLARCVPNLPLFWIDQAVVAGEQLDFRPAELEALVMSAADAHRGGGGWSVVAGDRTDNEEHPLVCDSDAYRLAVEGEDRDASLILGPSPMGTFIRFVPEPDRTRTGPSIAPSVVRAFAFADRTFGTGFGPLASAQDVR